jgi:predicted outer membrane repeat protein
MSNCLYAGNRAQGDGGAIFNHASSVGILNCTFGDNFAPYGSAIFSRADYGGTDSYADIANCIIRGGQSRLIYGEKYEISYSNIEGGWAGEGNIDGDPCFAHAGHFFDPCTPEDPCDDLWIAGDYHPQPGSPCIDAGDNTAVPSVWPYWTEDLDGEPRLEDDPCTPDTGSGTPPIVDMGAYEGTGYATFFTLSTERITVPEGGTAEFTVAISSEITGPLEAAVKVHCGDPDITIKSGALLLFDANNYAVSQIVTLQAAEDAFFLEGTAYISIEADNCITAVVTATEADNEPSVNIMYVDQNAPGANNGSSWKDAYTDLQTAIEAAELLGGLIDEIRVAQGRYTPAEPFSDDRNATFRLVSGVAMKGGYAGYGRADPDDRNVRKYETILSGDINGDDGPNFANTGDNSNRVVYARDVDVGTLLDGFTVTKSQGGVGGGIDFYRSDVVVSNCIITENSGQDGGGFYVEAGRSVLRNCTITRNKARYRGGGIYLGWGWNLGTVTIEGCTISANTARSEGGAIYQSGLSRLKIVNSLIIGNKTMNGRGGAIYGRGANLTISGSTFSGNVAGELGGAVFCSGSSPVISSSIFWDNSAPSGPQMVLSDCAGYSGDPNYFPVAISYSNIEGGQSAINLEEGCSLVLARLGAREYRCRPLFCEDRILASRQRW